MNLIAFHSAARDEMLEAAEYYEEQASGLGAQFTDAVERAVHFVNEHPDSGSFIGEANTLQRWTLRRFPYYVIYRAESEKIYILAVAHQRKRPGYWKNRV
jgi:plasmid stabilization system protein ParE